MWSWLTDLGSDLHDLVYDLFTFIFPYVWFGLVCHYYYLVTFEPLVDVAFYLGPFYLALCLLFSAFPFAIHLTWFTLGHYSVATWLGLQLMEGAWWTFFKWLKFLLGIF